MANNSITEQLQKLYNLKQKGILSEEEYNVEKAKILAPENKVEEPLPATSSWQMEPLFLSIKSFIEKSKFILIGLAVAVLAGWGVDYFILKPNPEKDAKKIATAYCECQEKSNEAIIKATEEFLNSFNSSTFKNRADAHAKYSSQQASAIESVAECNSQATLLYAKLRERYLPNAVDLQKFDNTYSVQQSACAPANKSKLTTLQASVEEKIQSIVEPAPDENGVKEKLIGRMVTGWYFANLSEFQNLAISSKIITDNRAEYKIDFTVASANSKNICSYKDALVVFTRNYEGGWDYQNISITSYEWTITVGNTWQEIKLPTNITYQINTKGLKGWIKDDSWFPKSFKIGPDADELSLHTSTIYLASREPNQEIPITLTIIPKLQ